MRTFRRLFRLMRTTAFLVVLSVSLLFSTAVLAAKVLVLSAQVTMYMANAATSAIKNRKEIAKAVMRAKAKARLRRFIAVVPLVGVGAVVAFEEQDYREWLEEHPEGTRRDYACETAALTAEVIDEVLAELPDFARPSREMALSFMPDCTVE